MKLDFKQILALVFGGIVIILMAIFYIGYNNLNSEETNTSVNYQDIRQDEVTYLNPDRPIEQIAAYRRDWITSTDKQLDFIENNNPEPLIAHWEGVYSEIYPILSEFTTEEEIRDASLLLESIKNYIGSLEERKIHMNNLKESTTELRNYLLKLEDGEWNREADTLVYEVRNAIYQLDDHHSIEVQTKAKKIDELIADAENKYGVYY